MNKNKYKCAQCGGVFDKGWSDEEALEEKEELWGNISLEDCAVICDDCWQKYHPEKHSEKARECGYNN